VLDSPVDTVRVLYVVVDVLVLHLSIIRAHINILIACVLVAVIDVFSVL